MDFLSWNSSKRFGASAQDFLSFLESSAMDDRIFRLRSVIIYCVESCKSPSYSVDYNHKRVSLTWDSVPINFSTFGASSNREAGSHFGRINTAGIILSLPMWIVSLDGLLRDDHMRETACIRLIAEIPGWCRLPIIDNVRSGRFT